MDRDSATILDQLANALLNRITGQSTRGIGPAGPSGDPMPNFPDMPGMPGSGAEEPDLLPGFRLAVQGLELTQSVQHYRSGRRADNSVPLVALKPLVVRAYPYVARGLVGRDMLSGRRITGELSLTQWNKEVYATGPTRIAGARAGGEEELDRELWDQDFSFSGGGTAIAAEIHHVNAPLNFYVPAWYLRAGPMRATVRLWLVGMHPLSGVSASHFFQLADVEAPRIGLVRVNWRNSGGLVSTVGDEAMLATTGFAESMFPFPYFETTILNHELTRSGDFWPPATIGTCNQNWLNLLSDLAVTRLFMAIFELGDIVFGMVSRIGIPPLAKDGQINSGCGSAEKGVGACFVDFAAAFAHEIGHIYGRNHVAVTDDPTNDPDYRDNMGRVRSIGEVGIDARSPAVSLFSPSTSDDIMSYGKNLWISPYTYRSLFDARDAHQSAPADPERVRPFIILSFRIQRQLDGSRSIEIDKAHKIAAPGFAPSTPGTQPSAVSIDLLDSEDRILATHHCYRLRASAQGCCGRGGQVPEDRETRLDFVEAIECPEGVAKLSFHRGEEPLATITAGKAPKVHLDGPERLEERLALKVRVSHPRETPSVVILFSADDGACWIPVAIDPPADGPIIIDPRRLKGGTRCRFRAVATAQLQSALADTGPFELDSCGRGLFARATPRPGEPGMVELRAFVDTRGLGPVLPHEVTWTSDRDSELGRGFTLLARLWTGRHEITVSIPDGLGGTVKERIATSVD
jgi:hypothetical protein